MNLWQNLSMKNLRKAGFTEQTLVSLVALNLVFLCLLSPPRKLALRPVARNKDAPAMSLVILITTMLPCRALENFEARASPFLS
jgi:hypothetical protein